MQNSEKETLLVFAAAVMGAVSLAIFLAYHNLADGDLWSRLIQGSSIWYTGKLMTKDIFSFTPTLAQYIDHEWASGLIFFSLLKLFGPASLLFFKIFTALGALILALAAGRILKASFQALLTVAVFSAWAVFPGFVPVVRCHTITYLFFGAFLFLLELIRSGRRWPSLMLVIMSALWANLHAGFAIGLVAIALYAFSDILSGRRRILMISTLAAAILVTLINPYGIKLWAYLMTVVTHIPGNVNEWLPMPLTGFDSFLGFRALFAFAVISVAVGWRRINNSKEYLPGLLMLALTAYMTFRSRRHAPFFGIACAAFLGTYIDAAFRLKERVNYLLIAGIGYLLIAFLGIMIILPKTPFMILSPVGFYPVREADILAYSKAKGNLLVPLRWGNYAIWRLYPDIKVSISGRFDTIYPEETRRMNNDFFFKEGDGWDRILKRYDVDYIMIECTNTHLVSKDLTERGYEPVWTDAGSALFARREKAAPLKIIARSLPARTIEPLDAEIPRKWYNK